MTKAKVATEAPKTQTKEVVQEPKVVKQAPPKKQRSIK